MRYGNISDSKRITNLTESRNLSSIIVERVQRPLVLASDGKLLELKPTRISGKPISRLSSGQAYYPGLCHTKLTVGELF